MEEKKHAPKSNGFHDPSEEVSDDEGSPCGVMGCNPAPMQSLRKPVVVLIFLSITAFMQGFVVNGLVNVVTTSLERRFSLSSAASGLVSSCYDIGYLLCTVPVAYFGGRKGSSKPRWLGAGILLIALGSFLFALPHFLIPTYSPKLPTEGGQNNDTVTEDELCVDDRESQDKCTFQLDPRGNHSVEGWIPEVCRFGMLKEEDLDAADRRGSFNGRCPFFYFMATVGPGVGFFFGAYQLSLHTNFLELDDSKINITSSSSLWVGAWWLGFALNAVFALVVSIPVFALPANLPGSKAMRAARVNEVHHGPATTKDSENDEKEGFLIQLRRLLLNPVYMFLMAAGTFEIALTVGGTTFAGKLNETNYGFSASEAAFLLGSVTMPVIGGMTLLGGYVVKRFALSVKQIIKLCAVTSFIALALNSGYLFTCPQETIIGINGEYNTGGSSFHLDSGSRTFFSLAIVFKVVSGTSYMLAAFLYRAPKEDPKGTDAQHDVISASEASLTTPPENYHVETDSLYTKL
ncbi:unnamed protein product [Cyprideis torosa]|uniref:Uncharacterized protein n=1 Tax=Cyprideis torosa TaxID=163714 RepID=A0A7R8WA78_9CRUS|nr:unnamed protein product [Cyprideis torosa]CAG0886063.1 unnamed protein product [Cyprideis torosa]